jgi:hypothetical protein
MRRRRLIDMPGHIADDLRGLRRKTVLLGLLHRKSEDEIYREEIDVVVRAARLEGCDESDVEVAAARARRDVADLLAEFREPREGVDWTDDIIAALNVGKES